MADPVNFFLDFETKSLSDLETVGLDNYVHDPTTAVLLLAYAFDNNPVKLWQPHIEPEIPDEVRAALDNPFIRKIAFNCAFERAILKHQLGFDVPVSEFRDVLVLCRYLSVPGPLEDCCRIVGLKPEESKIADGDRLIRLFSLPCHQGGEETLFGVSEPAWRDWNTDPADWEKFCAYAKQDVVAERAILRKLRRYPLPEDEQKMWELDQHINERGIPVNLDFVAGALTVSNRAHAEVKEKLLALTKLANPNSVPQLLGWVKERGYPYGALGKTWVNRALATAPLTPECREALLLRQQSARTSDTKFDAIWNVVSKTDHRLRHQFAFGGAARTLRWAGRDVQMQNLSRPVKSVEKQMERAIELLHKADYTAIKETFGNPLDVTASCIRSAFQTTPDKKFVVADLSAVENRVLGYIARCDAILKVFRDGLDPYVSFAVRMYGDPYEVLIKDKEKRQMAKPAVLGAGYRLGGGEEVQNAEGDTIRTGLWGYSQMLGISMSREEAHYSVRVFRDTYPEVVQLWYDLETASQAALKGGRHSVGPVVFEKIGKVLCCWLPSGRALHYINAKMEMREFNGQKRKQLVYDGLDMKTRQWVRVATHGGKLTENIDQAISRDLLANGMRLAEKRGLPVVLHCHDELVAEVPKTALQGLDDLIACMTEPPAWAPDLPMAAAGFEGSVYRKG